jgi:transcriptional regulator with XRE-family HTH domain
VPKKAEPTGFASRLKALREARGLTQQQLAELAGFYRYSIAKLEQGVQEPTWPTVLAIAKVLGVTCQEFMGEDDDGTQELPKRGPGRPAKSAAAPSPEAASAPARKRPPAAKRARPKKK